MFISTQCLPKTLEQNRNAKGEQKANAISIFVVCKSIEMEFHFKNFILNL